MTVTVPPPAPQQPESGQQVARRPPLLYLLIGLCVALAFLAATGGGVLVALRDRPAGDGADAGFARDMQTHHAQAVDMSMTILAKTKDPTLRSVAYDIATTQQQQIGQMYGWLELWKLPQTGGPPMAWMHDKAAMPSAQHDMSTMSTTAAGMPGMATPAQLERLRAADGAKAETLYLQLMIRHHQGGIEMARAIRDLGKQPQVLDLAQKMIDSQTAEITQMQKLLKQRQP